MYGQNFKNFPQNVRIGAGMGPKSQNLFGLSVRPPKNQNLFGRGHQAPKTANFRSDWPSGLKNKPKMTMRQLYVQNHLTLRLSYSASIPSVLLASPDFRRPFLHAPTTAFTPFKTSCTLVYEAINECKKKRPKFYPRYEGTVSAAMSFTNDHCTL